MKLAVVTDSSAYLPERIKNHPDLFVIPIPLIMDGKMLLTKESISKRMNIMDF